MIVQAWYKGAKVVLNVPTEMLVFDGEKFVEPHTAKFVTLVEIYNGASTADAPRSYPVNKFTSPVNVLEWTNPWVCKVIFVGSDDDQLPVDVVTAPAPADGMCVCLVTCSGTEVQTVQIL